MYKKGIIVVVSAIVILGFLAGCSRADDSDVLIDEENDGEFEMNENKKFGLDIDVQGESFYCVVEKDRLEDFFDFLKEKADYFSLECYYDGKVSKEQFKALEEEGKQFIELQRKAYETNENDYRDILEDTMNIKTEKDAIRYFKQVKKDYKENILDEVKHQKGEGKQIDEQIMSEKGMLECKLTCNTPATMGSARNIYYFPAECLDNVIGEMNTLYDYINIDGFQFENLTFYRDAYDKPDTEFYVTTTHESCILASLNQEELEELINDKIIKID